MTTPPSAPHLKVIVVDNAAVTDLLRLLQQLAKTAPREVEIVVASLRNPRLPSVLARRVRRLSAKTAEAMDAAVLAEATAPRLALVASAAGRVSSGWIEEITQRAEIYRDVTSAIDALEGGFLLYPPGVTSAAVQNVSWLQVKHLTSRGRGELEVAETTVSAVLIVKNEEDVLDECLTAVAPFVDEIVVYDTGSTDTTMDIARQHGAVLIEGYWDDHFGNARNRALEHATGQWVLQVDADEVMQGDPGEFRTRLAVEPCDQMHLKIVSSSWRGVTSGLETLPVRVFRRGTARWIGALHEYPAPIEGDTVHLSPIPAPARLIHSGYESSKVADRDKTTRNIDLSRRELDETPVGSPTRGERLSNLIRSLLWANDFEASFPLLEELLVTEGNPTALCMGGRPAVGIMLAFNRVDDATAWIDKLEKTGESAGNVAVMRGRVHLHLSEFAEAKSVVEPFREGADGGKDPWGIAFDVSQIDLLLADIALAEGDPAGAIDKYLAVLPISPGSLDLNRVLNTFVSIDRPLRELAQAAPEDLLARSLREAAAYHPSGALAWFDACHEAHPRDMRFVVAGNLFASRSDWQTALTWTSRARTMGLTDVCALTSLTERTTAPLVDRAVAAALLVHVDGKATSDVSFGALVADMDDAEVTQLATVLTQLGVSIPLPDAEQEADSSEVTVESAV